MRIMGAWRLSGAMNLPHGKAVVPLPTQTGKVDPTRPGTHLRGCSSVVERHVANVNVGRSNRLTRFQTTKPLSRICGGGFSIRSLKERSVRTTPLHGGVCCWWIRNRSGFGALCGIDAVDIPELHRVPGQPLLVLPSHFTSAGEKPASDRRARS